MEAKKTKLVDICQVALSTIDYYHQLYKQNKLTLEKARQLALENIESLRFGNDHKNYFWVLDTSGILLAHPYLAKNQNLTRAADTSISAPVIRMLEITAAGGSGYINYTWQWKDVKNQVEPKTSYIQLYEPWQWIVGAGLYTVDIEEQIRAYMRKFVLISIIAVLIVLFIHIMLMRDSYNLFKAYWQEKENAQEKEKEFRHLTENISHGITFQEGKEIIYINPAMIHILGIKGQAIRTGDLFSYIIPEEKERIDAIYHSITTTGYPISELTFWIKNAVGQMKYLKNRFYSVQISNNRTIRYIMTTDITNEIEHEQELRKLSETVKQSPASIVITDIEGKIEYVNPKFEELTGYTMDEVLGQNPRMLKSGKMQEDIYHTMWKTISQGKSWRGELLNQRKNGALIWESTNISPIFDEDGDITHYVAVKEDITDRKKLNKELIIAKEKAEESDRLKSSFLANLSHEIRTPLNAIVGFTSLIQSQNKDESIDKFTELIVSNAEILLKVIDEIIEISKIEAGDVNVNITEINLKQLFNELNETYRQTIKNEKNKILNIQTTVPANMPAVVYSDSLRLKRIFHNLLSNAVKFTDQGEIIFGIANRTNNQLTFFVKDTGIGIPLTDQPKIFERFEHGTSRYVSLHKGTGLGLTITKSLVELLGGKIWFDSSEEEGSVFYFTIVDQQYSETLM
ncbi:MAG: PAS domain S-box protein [Bacteroidetes bacterium]|nr:PAS domain S-box protein [Bacteroidota bacterium]